MERSLGESDHGVLQVKSIKKYALPGVKFVADFAVIKEWCLGYEARKMCWTIESPNPSDGDRDFIARRNIIPN